jgi:hypothetical protein
MSFRSYMRNTLTVTAPMLVGIVSFLGWACAPSLSPSGTRSPVADMSTSPPSPDPRVGLRAGWYGGGEAIWNLQLVSQTKPSASFINLSTPGDPRLWNSDLAFAGNYVFQGNFGGYQVWDISNPAKPTLRSAYVCPGSQSHVST